MPTDPNADTQNHHALSNDDDVVDGLSELWIALGSQLDFRSQLAIRSFFRDRHALTIASVVDDNLLNDFNTELASLTKVLLLKSLAFIDKFSKQRKAASISVVSISGRVMHTIRFERQRSIIEVRGEVSKVSGLSVGKLLSQTRVLRDSDTMCDAGLQNADILTAVIEDKTLSIHFSNQLSVRPATGKDWRQIVWKRQTDASDLIERIMALGEWEQWRRSHEDEAAELIRFLSGATDVHYVPQNGYEQHKATALVDGHLVDVVSPPILYGHVCAFTLIRTQDYPW